VGFGAGGLVVRVVDGSVPGCETACAQILLHYKGQEAVERRYSAFKGTLAVAAIYLKNNRRVTAMITVVCLALLICSIIERQVRNALTALGRTIIAGLYAGRPARPDHPTHPANPRHHETHPRSRR
jgi:transposase